ncbi:MAG: hypothetical protein HDT39_04525 [Lachnospiraceae bacterium]|nr:hypothetical protein [Lachnospiraceae bacterium]
MFTIFLFLLFIISIAIIYEIKTYNIHPYIWVVGGILGLVCNVMGLGIVSWLEGVIAGVVLLLMVIIIILSDALSRCVGGGTLKGFFTIGMLLGRYSFFTVINFIVIYLICKILLRKGFIRGRGLLYGTPLLFICVVFTCGEYFFISYL